MTRPDHTWLMVPSHKRRKLSGAVEPDGREIYSELAGLARYPVRLGVAVCAACGLACEAGDPRAAMALLVWHWREHHVASVNAPPEVPELRTKQVRLTVLPKPLPPQITPHPDQNSATDMALFMALGLAREAGYRGHDRHRAHAMAQEQTIMFITHESDARVAQTAKVAEAKAAYALRNPGDVGAMVRAVNTALVVRADAGVAIDVCEAAEAAYMGSVPRGAAWFSTVVRNVFADARLIATGRLA